ncbi:MAG: GH39 family glycosyl hydrolase [Candidatus Kryptoniota bacterium]
MISSAGIVVDFANRSDATHPIPDHFMGSGFGFFGSYQDYAWNLLKQAGIINVRFDANIPQVFQTTTPNWSKIDSTISYVARMNLHPIMIMDYTPPWLQPQTSPCDSVIPAHDVPTSISKWADIAAQYVHHMDSLFPGIVKNYEIWNEPDGPTFLCAPNDSVRFVEYDSIFAEAAPRMLAQANADGDTIRIGGPTLANPVGHMNNWLTRLLNDSETAPYVDFVSYHHYLTGCNWPPNWSGMVSLTQNRWSGVEAVFNRLAMIVRSGKQPGAANTPIYIDEYNSSACNKGQIDPYRNTANYSPVWNGLFVIDALSAAYDSSHTIPSKLLYFTASFPGNGFCLLGAIDPEMNCANSTSSLPQPYPQYFFYDLLANANYLDVTHDGYLAHFVSTSTDSLFAAAFYTPNSESVLIVNPTLTDYSQTTVSVNNPGFSPTIDSLYLSNGANQQITASALNKVSAPNGYESVVDVPPLSVVALKYGMTSTGINGGGQALPEHFNLRQNYPNPFNPSTIISYRIPVVSYVSIRVYDMLGREVKTLVSERQNPGNYLVRFDAQTLPSGVYFCRMNAGAFRKVIKIVLIK